MSQEREPGWYWVRYGEGYGEWEPMKWHDGWWWGIGTSGSYSEVFLNDVGGRIFPPDAAQAVAAHAREPDETMVATAEEAAEKYLRLIGEPFERAPLVKIIAEALAAIGSGRSERDAVIDRQIAKKAIAEALDDWWETHVEESPGQALVDEIMGALTLAKLIAKSSPEKPPAPILQASFQARVGEWMAACFTPEICADKIERNHRFLEEALELVQALGCTASEAHQLVDYTFNRPQGEVNQEVGGVMVTLAALCLASDLDMEAGGEKELARIWTKIDQIRAKQAGKPKHSPLPEHTATPPAAERAKPAASDLERAHTVCGDLATTMHLAEPWSNEAAEIIAAALAEARREAAADIMHQPKPAGARIPNPNLPLGSRHPMAGEG